MDYILENAYILRRGRLCPASIVVCAGRIVSLEGGAERFPGACRIDLHHGVVFPGFVDVHVHLREPGFSYKETIRTGTLAAARGGFTHVCSMPNLNPVPDCRQHLARQLEIIRDSAAIHVHPYGAITVGQQGERLAALAEMAGDVVAFSDDGRGVQSEEMMRAAMTEAKRLGKIITAHCEDNSLLRGGYIHDGAYARRHGHKGICSESEWGQVARDLRLAEETGCPYHICHISTRESVQLVREAKRRGVDVTCETAPHYLAFTEDDLQEDGRFKMNPPLRSTADREALLAGIADGTIDMIATDHAPHSAEEKSRGLAGSAMGVVGLETAFAACYTHLVRPGIISLEQLVELLHGAPRRRFGVGTELAEGQSASLTVFDLERHFTVDPEQFVSMGRATPFAGTALYGACRLTMADGQIAWQEERE